MAEALPKLTDEFRDFLIEAKQHGYGSDRPRKLSTPNGGTEIVYCREPWLYTDMYEGGDPYGGHESVAYKRQNGSESWLPIWEMSYRGKVIDPIFLQRISLALPYVLSKPEYEMPIRGPFKDEWKGYNYELRFEGAIEEFTATERFHEMRDLYVAHFLGGFVNRQAWGKFADRPWIKSNG